MNARPPADPSLADLDAQALDWFVLSQRGLTAAEQVAFDRWLADDDAHGQALARWRGDWMALDALPADGVAQLRAQLADDQARAAARMPAGHAWLEGLRDWMPRPGMAAFVLCVSATSFMVWNHWQQQPVFEQTFATARGQQLDVQLPDGSHLRLDTATRAEVTLYRKHRELRLPEGQVVLQVQADAARPFDVRAGDVTVTVVGTRFSVRHTPDIPGDDGVRVAVEEGRVRVASLPDAVVQLAAGQQVVADGRGRLGAVSGVAAAGIAPWRDGRITFDNTPLDQVLAEFERYGRTGLIVRDDQVAALRLTGTFDPRRMNNFMLALPKVLPVRLRARGGFTEIAPAS